MNFRGKARIFWKLRSFIYSIEYCFHQDGVWSEVQVVSKGCDDGSSIPDIALYRDKVHVVWEDFSDILGSGGGKDVFHRVLCDGAWESVRVVSTESDSWSYSPAVAVHDGVTHIFWTDSSVFGLGAGNNIIFKIGSDSGGSGQGFPYWILLLLILVIVAVYVEKRYIDEKAEEH